MSHFTHIKTRFQNLSYLEKALNQLNISYKYKENQSSNFDNTSLIIPQSNGYNIEFISNNQEYELVADLSFWQQPYKIESFIDKLSQKYAVVAIVEESQKIGFQVTKGKQNFDGSNTLILERWK